MLVVRKIEKLLRWQKKFPQAKRVGFVPTMGDLHPGHFSLIARSKKENDFTVVSIFVNPLQFNDPRDFNLYQRNLEKDIETSRKAGVDLLFVPSCKEIYPEGFQSEVHIKNLSKHLCGPRRPGHFEGVATIVLKLFHLVQPQQAYFGLKDYQQFQILLQMVKDLNLPIKIVPCPTVREPDGLPYSSRNQRLSPQERERARRILPALQSVADLLRYNQTLNQKRVFSCYVKNLKLTKMDRVEYLEIVEPKTLMPLKKVQYPMLIATAVWIGRTRLIDNLFLKKVKS